MANVASKEASYEKTHRNLRTEDRARAVLLQADPCYQQLELDARKIILAHFGQDPKRHRTFDLIRTGSAVGQLDAASIIGHLDSITLIELKGTQKPIQDDSLKGFFFGATENEFNMARELGSRYRFAFVVLNDDNIHNKPFFVELTLEELEKRIRTKRLQYQINF
jgi:hypothetical protein